MLRELKDLKNCLMKYDLPSRFFILRFIKEFADAGEEIGLTKKISRKLSIYTTIGTINLLHNENTLFT